MRVSHGAGSTRWLAGAVVALLLVAGAACAPARAPLAAPPAQPSAQPAPAAQPAAAPCDTPLARLQGELRTIFEDPRFARMQWAVLVQSLASGEVIYSANVGKLMMPASNMKIVTLAAAAERLGWDFTYETRLLTSAAVKNGVLDGDLIVVGSGDPTIGSRGGGSSTRVFEAWADQLEAAGIRAINGRIVADARAFDAQPLGASWEWDDLPLAYAAGVSALQFNESVADVAIRPGPSVGSPAVIDVRPIESGLLLDAKVTTSAGGEADLALSRLQGTNHLVVGGTIPAGSKEVVRAASVSRPALYFVRVLRETLVARGIRVTGTAAEFDDAYPVPPTAQARVLLSHRSAPLSEFARTLMKVSQNQYAETLLRTLGATTGAGTPAAGQQVVREVLDGWGVPADAYVLSDGSGLSRHNYVSAEMLTTILRQMYRDPRHRESFLATLPVAGEDGTLKRRFAGSRVAGNVKAKTGTIANVRSLSGYATTLDGEPIVFSMLANHFSTPSSVVDAAVDHALERVVSFTRK
jgi:serine-type D-Ala-D-Ala carboxypeptidase/endopeptidase (penicillin-binding protein 4)